KNLFKKDVLSVFPTYLYYSQRITHIEAEIKIDPVNQTIESEGRVDFEVGYDKPAKFYLMVSLENASFWDENGDAEFKIKNVFGIPMAEVVAKSELMKGEKSSLFFKLTGKPSCEPESLMGVLICTFSNEISYSALELMTPSSISGDYATFDIKFVIPEGYILASTGVTKEVSGNNDGTATHHAVQDYPTEIHSFGFAPYNVSAMPFMEKWFRAYTLSNPVTELSLGKTLQDMQDVVFHYSTQYGDFIFPKMEAIEIYNDAGAAFGWPTMLMIPTYSWITEEFGRVTLFAHELGHQWFPNMLKNYDSYAPWLSEGFAEFSAVTYINKRYGSDYERGYLRQLGLAYIYYLPPAYDFPLTSPDLYNVNNAWVYMLVTYYKGAFVLSMLKYVMGEEKFFAALRNLYADYAGQDKYYDTDILKTYFDAAYGEPIDWG
ncbi:MAG: hypothetical protein FJ088_14125, partial [Deltaproteobacteria bacterium]|nr:hypothetical protein [Deltaproteobacteria bacterium]